MSLSARSRTRSAPGNRLPFPSIAVFPEVDGCSEVDGSPKVASVRALGEQECFISAPRDCNTALRISDLGFGA